MTEKRHPDLPVEEARKYIEGMRASGKLASAVAGWRRVADTESNDVAWERIVEAFYKKTWGVPFTEAVAAAYCREVGLGHIALVTLPNGTMPREQRWVQVPNWLLAEGDSMKKPRHQGKYDLVVVTPPEDLTQVELATLMALPTFLTELSNLPGFDPTDVTVQLSWKSTGHVGCAKLQKKGSGLGSAT